MSSLFGSLGALAAMDTEYLGQLVTGFAYLVVGVGLARLAQRSGQRPERLLGIYFLLTSLDYIGYAAPRVFALDALFSTTEAVSRVSYAIAVGALVIFTREVFRSAQVWALWLMWSCIAGVAVGIVGSLATGQGIYPTPSDFFFWPYYLGYTSACLWVASEALLSYTKARKRLAIGLCKPTVVNRYLLWGAFGVLQVLACGVLLIVYSQEASAGAAARWADMLLSATEVSSVGMLWLAFFPPTFYRNWIVGSGTDTGTPEAS
jgi:hypothetical protein